MRQAVVVRFGTLGLAVAVVVWSITCFPTVLVGYTADRVARAIGQGERFNEAELAKVDRHLASVLAYDACAKPLVHDDLMVKMSLADEAAEQRDVGVFDERVSDLEQAARQVIACSPRDGAAWLILYWIETQRFGLRESGLRRLRASYEVAPREAWISVRRSRLVIPIVTWLPKDLQTVAFAEYNDLIRAGLLDDALAILSSLDKPHMMTIIKSLDTLPSDETWAFKKLVQSKNLADSAALNLPQKPYRPW